MGNDLILGIESSCDETSAAVVENGRNVLSNIIASQIDWHRKFGGVVPEIASRKHVELMNPVIEEAMVEAGVKFADLSAVAVTYGPGLVGGLLVGIAAAKGIAYAQQIPLIAINHIEGHIYSNFIAHEDLEPPLVCLTVSGGHTDLLYFSEFGEYQILGRTRDDAAGESFDKVARVLELGYPGGPIIDKLAKEGDEEAIDLPRPLINADNYDFSFSGLKTAVLNYINNQEQRGEEINKANLAASFQQAVVDILVAKVIKAVKETKVKNVILAGGVASNRQLRVELESKLYDLGVELHFPPPKLCTDNAAMIASVGYYHWKSGMRTDYDLNAEPNLQLG
ncbi:MULTISPECIES: tRNA (adenosine(37)-N6)-threonylcarbamoyltransferase complex transferase subunit TsaD [unclassified Candidatus Frackibacter]|uniref:tRNA (adenosine(37)-N6)-threonylcarbamoyltransferase complex transferase subunit TsaD n=1 Tax=unclassified Candidatus Frackibacter TaxID=2648818 RepID=UPI0008923FD7|nr:MULTISPECIES: tRNA (adenosine(37)-N6)-threonylcarbamoyltransferase complex transferase subunit TsaD [unclassified Candidatus Frackibacter]SDC23738.1 O-sialoglycoprotein endopeptidase [Candidatus Frackibacter sp. WG11]SEM48258.1 O-sialoglycoprotein endopeptidase [Candidatus Frackibacter sp. WG12]SFL50169.1 O-sialoglycoprotein endopeptidase [Candidatus Frackibacter sp. WG13]